MPIRVIPQSWGLVPYDQCESRSWPYIKVLLSFPAGFLYWWKTLEANLWPTSIKRPDLTTSLHAFWVPFTILHSASLVFATLILLFCFIYPTAFYVLCKPPESCWRQRSITKTQVYWDPVLCEAQCWAEGTTVDKATSAGDIYTDI